MDARSMSMSMSSVGKVVYESVHRGTAAEVQQLPEAIANQRNNLLYCPSPYATTRVSLFFPTGSGSHSLRPGDGHQSNAMSSEQNCYDMPIIKPVGSHVNLFDVVVIATRGVGITRGWESATNLLIAS